MAQNTVIRTNILAINSHRHLGLVGTQQARSSQRLSSGYRINTSADDAAGLAISEKMRAQIRGLDQASRNTQDAISLIQTAEGGMQEIDNMIQRIRELVVYASNDHLEQDTRGNVQGDRRKIQDEIDQLLQEIDSMANRVEFNRKILLDGTFSAIGQIRTANMAIVASANIAFVAATNDFSDSITEALAQINRAIDLATRDAADGTGIFGLSANAGCPIRMDAVALNSANTDRQNAIMDLRNLERALITLQTGTSRAGATLTSAFFSTLWSPNVSNISAYATAVGGISAAVVRGASSEAFTNALSAIGAMINGGGGASTSVSAAGAALYSAAQQVTTDRSDAVKSAFIGTALHFQVGANSNQSLRLNIGAVNTFALGLAAGLGDSGKLIDIMQITGAAATGLLNRLDEAATIVATERSKLGAAQNRLEFTDNSLKISSENLQAAESRIRNTDMGAEMMRLTQANILQQAAISMLAQGNMAPQAVLQLLQ